MRKLPALLLAASCLFAQAPASWTPEFSMRITRVSDVIPSPDGKMAAWTQTRAIIETEKSENLSHIFLWRGANSRPLQLTRGDKSAQDPAFSPDGKTIYFTSDRSGKKNVFRIDIDGGEAEMLTDLKGSLNSFHLSPDGKWVAYTSADPDPDDEKAKKEKRDVKVIDEKPKNASLYVISVEPDAAGKRTPKKLVQAAHHTGEFRWSPDSRRIAFEHRPTPDFDNGRLADISEVEVESATVKALASTAATETQPRYSPNGRYLAFLKSSDVPSSLKGARVALLDRNTNSVRLLPATPDERPQLLDWDSRSTRLYLAEGRRTRSAVYAMPLDGPPALAYTTEKGVVRPGNVLSRDGTLAGAVVESPAQAAEACLLNLETKQLVQASRANSDLLKPPLGETKVITWKVKDGKEIDGVLTLPTNYEQGKRYPLALIIHGGPAGAFQETFIGSSGAQSVASFAAKGYAVLRPNPRGSVGYGIAFSAANFQDWGGGDYQDLMAGVDQLISQGIADADRLAVMGWSYGGYMTSWVITQTPRFKAAIIGAGITNLWSMWGTNDIPSVLDDYFGGSPWNRHELYQRRSGLFYADKVKTPTLFLHGEADLRVPIGQAYEYYHALKRLGVTTKMVAYPRTPHGPQEPKFVLDVMQRHLDWVEAYAK